ncbi:MAG: matrixin family metalloprotease, partial [Stackebrandtia sp.]
EWMIPMITLSRAAAVLVFFVAGLTLAVAAPAHAADIPVRWLGNVVCVDNHAGSRWPVAEAVHRIDAAVDLVLLYESCKGHDQVITVEDVSEPGESYAGRTHYSHDRGGLLYSVRIDLNDATTERHYARNQLTVVQHELLHALGAEHAESTVSLMAHDGSEYRWTEPQPEDVTTINALYAWPQTVA